MPNARDAHATAAPRILLLGETGSGKTSQFLTLPGKKFIYLFDPNAILSLQGYDLDYEEFLPDKIPLNISSLSGEKKGGRADPTALRDAQTDVYLQWERHFERGLESGFFDAYDWVGFDSYTTFSDMVMDRVLVLNNRPGAWAQQDDYGPQMNAVKNVTRTLTSLGIGLFCTGHLDTVQDGLTKRLSKTPLLTGRLKKSIPLLFSEILGTTTESDNKGGILFKMQTKPDSMFQTCRTSIKGLNAVEDVTIDFKKSPVGQGIGKWFNFTRGGIAL
jgi:hypothetical protein